MKRRLQFSFKRFKPVQRSVITLVLVLFVWDFAYHILSPDDHHDHPSSQLAILSASFHPDSSPLPSEEGDLGDGCFALHHHHYPAVLEASSFALPFVAFTRPINDDCRLFGHPHSIKKQNRGPPSV